VATPSPNRTYPLSTAPRTIPAVREHIAARGPGWRPGPDAGVVLAGGSGALADEGRLLAQELSIHYRGDVPARPGDVELALTPGKGTPESYTLRARDGRVTISGPDQAGV
ncbi:beta-N-acetylglucosaminidase, partial [Streptomyces sp. NPDC057545]